VASLLRRFLPHRAGPWVYSIWHSEGDGRTVYRAAVQPSSGPLFRCVISDWFLLHVHRHRPAVTAVLLLIPRTALLGAIFYFPIILNICVLAYSVRFEGTRITTLMLLANMFLLAWDYPRLKSILPFSRHGDPRVVESRKFPVLFLRLFSRRPF
jgi:hypothetical protein